MATHNEHSTVGAFQRFLGFLITSAVLFVLMVVFLASVDALPEKGSLAAQAPSQQSGLAEAPVRIIARSIGLDAAITNPSSTDVSVLDQALTRGAVRYPTSGLLGVDGTVLLFGHSSYLPVVYNQYYKTFNAIQNLKKGEVVSVFSGTTEYRYAVKEVRVADATEDVVELPTNGKYLVLVTCDTFTKKTSRFVVTAELVGTYSLTSN